MRAWEVNDGILNWSQVADPEPGTDEAAVKVVSAGVCASDLAKLTKSVIPTPPGRAWRPGHEIVGQLDGHAVAINPLVPCGDCARCQQGAINVCPRVSMIGWHRPGGFAEYVTAPRANLVRLPDHLDATVAVLAEPTAVAVHGVRCGLRGTPGRLGVIGGGTIALATAAYATARGWAVDLLVRDPTRVVPLPIAVRPLAGLLPRSYDAVVDAASGTDDTSFTAALDAVRDGGDVVVQTAYHPGVRLSRDLREPIRRALTIRGSFSFCQEGGADDFHEALHLLAGDGQWASSLSARRYPMDGLRRALVDLRSTASGRPRKAILVP